MTDNKVTSETLSLCESCGVRKKHFDRRWCRPCILSWQRKSEENARQLGCIIDHCRLDDVIPERYRDATIEQIPKAIRKTFEELPEDKGLYFWGSPGIGKTYSLCAITRKLFFDGWDVARVTYEMLALKIRGTYREGSTITELDVIKPMIEVDKLILEDVGTTISIGQQESNFSLRTFLIILDQRLENCRATYVSSNKSIEELGKSFDQRIASRLQQACEIIQLKGQDKRIG